ncbi:hypothetical protein RSK20926_02639 [Roseobacter sp. SK209-2-6]|uniref:TadE/TadG family type IV pilus assembly protein n=1 Tax=Roseobacter sp. SK209-2-6 TaxID=388739 RepID=UPI0000F3ED20|nr:hypothetical protein [Roseobacter sp. SK209-2-6]EBA16666.1 hypothetical protein RSK20926_02639 [Roseobacter sp. SK209-2-6]
MEQSIFHKLKSFRQKQEGSVTVEFVIYIPLLLWLFAAIYTFFDAFRQESINLKAAYTVSDLISRETTTLTEDYMDSMHEMTQLLIRGDSSVSLRVTVVRWDEDNDRYYVDWSKVRGDNLAGTFTAWTNATVGEIEDDLPNMPDEERVIVVETFNDLVPAFEVGLPDLDIENFVFTRPRFAPLVYFEGVDVGGGSHDDGGDSID